MSYIYTGEKGTSLKYILAEIERKTPVKYVSMRIEFRCKWIEPGETEWQDEFFGCCDYENGELISLDGDTYSLDDVYTDWEYEYVAIDECIYVTVWEEGRYSEEWEG